MWRQLRDLSLWLFAAEPGNTIKSRIPKSQEEDAKQVELVDYIERLKDAPSQDPLRKSLLKEQLQAQHVATEDQLKQNWLKNLAYPEVKEAPAEVQEFADASRQVYALCCNLFELLSNYAKQLNQYMGMSTLKISLTEPSEVSEKFSVGGPWPSLEQSEQRAYLRWRASTRTWSLSCRARESVIEIFLIPVSDTMLLSGGEQPFRQRLRLELTNQNGKPVWISDGLPLEADDLRMLMRQLFVELIRSTKDYEQPIQQYLVEEASGSQERLANSINQLLLERQNLAQKVVIQQEEIQKRIARDLHDAVISDVMALKRSLSSDKLSANDLTKSLETIVQRLREICYELSPRDLADWGLSTVIEDMLEHMAQRTGADCLLNCDLELPSLPSAVELHIYRIVQESLNNIEKYAQATKAVVNITLSGQTLTVEVADNGSGFVLSETNVKENMIGGYGMASLRERVDLISCFYPARLNIKSEPDKGSKVILEIDLTSGNQKTA
ncbi:MAG: sensor histidine kinase [Candidatus Obscuribacterales bacterium]|nr:sensor histidine kinase [Candidatus Obscuribacterales bacterium]